MTQDFLCFVFIIWLFLSPAISQDYNKLIFKGCANQKFQDQSGIYSQNLKTLISSLVSQSSQKVFSNLTSGNDQNSILGFYQCRGDLSITQCYDCVSKTPDLISKFCGGDGGNALAARVQLAGCYLRYEVAGFRQVPVNDLLYRVCGKKQISGDGFEGKRDTAFQMAENGVKSGGGFYAGEYQSVYVLGQCEGSLGNSDCGECVESAFERAKSDCGTSSSGQIYLHKCYVSYSFYSNGVPTISSSSPGGGGGEGKQHTQRTVALAVGGVAVLGFVIVCLMFLKSVLKKRSSKHDTYY